MGQETFIRYELELVRTEATTGHVAVEPMPLPDFSAAAAYLAEHPMDDYMHRHLAERIAVTAANNMDEVLQAVDDNRDNKALMAVFLEVGLTYPDFSAIRELLRDELQELKAHTPFLYLKHHALYDAPTPENELRKAWLEIMGPNLSCHTPLPAKDALPKPLYTAEELRPPSELTVAEAAKSMGPFDPSAPVPLDVTLRRAGEALGKSGLRADPEMRHEASLSPVALLRGWRMDIDVGVGNLHYRIGGNQTAFGRGLVVPPARVSYIMEIVERFSSWANIKDGKALGYVEDKPLLRAPFSELGPEKAVDPNALALEAPYEDEPLYWLEGIGIGPDGGKAMLVPAQCVFMFANLDEPALFSGLGTTGYAAGNDMDHVRLTGMLECIERDAEAVTPFSWESCFRIDSSKDDERELAELVEDYKAKGIDVVFQDVTTEFGVPCYKAFAEAPDGTLAKGAAAKMSGKAALVSAMLETTYPYPGGPPSKEAPKDLPLRKLADLPDVSTGSIAGDRAVLEAVLNAHGFTPAHVDLTRADLMIPVGRSIVPGLEIMTEFDEFMRLPKRLFARLP
jgi:ribosomal protein S12 methylthiotransferase accessory factor YcaO